MSNNSFITGTPGQKGQDGDDGNDGTNGKPGSAGPPGTIYFGTSLFWEYKTYFWN